MDFKKAAAGVALGASLLGAHMGDAEAAKVNHHKHQKISTISWDEVSRRYLTDPHVVAKVLAGESTSEEGMKAVACVIQNRMRNHGIASVNDVVMARKQFEPLTNPEMMERNYENNKDIADLYASKIGKLDDITDGAEHFRSVAQYTAHKAHYDRDYEVTGTIGGNVFMKERKKHDKTS